MTDYTEVNVPGEIKRRVQILAALQQTSEDRAVEQLIRHGLEAYLAEQAVPADVAGGPSAGPLPDNGTGA